MAEYRTIVTLEKILKFVKAVGDKNPIHADSEAAIYAYKDVLDLAKRNPKLMFRFIGNNFYSLTKAQEQGIKPIVKPVCYNSLDLIDDDFTMPLGDTANTISNATQSMYSEAFGLFLEGKNELDDMVIEAAVMPGNMSLSLDIWREIPEDETVVDLVYSLRDMSIVGRGRLTYQGGEKVTDAGHGTLIVDIGDNVVEPGVEVITKIDDKPTLQKNCRLRYNFKIGFERKQGTDNKTVFVPLAEGQIYTIGSFFNFKKVYDQILNELWGYIPERATNLKSNYYKILETLLNHDAFQKNKDVVASRTIFASYVLKDPNVKFVLLKEEEVIKLKYSFVKNGKVDEGEIKFSGSVPECVSDLMVLKEKTDSKENEFSLIKISNLLMDLQKGEYSKKIKAVWKEMMRYGLPKYDENKTELADLLLHIDKNKDVEARGDSRFYTDDVMIVERVLTEEDVRDYNESIGRDPDVVDFKVMESAIAGNLVEYFKQVYGEDQLKEKNLVYKKQTVKIDPNAEAPKIGDSYKLVLFRYYLRESDETGHSHKVYSIFINNKKVIMTGESSGMVLPKK